MASIPRPLVRRSISVPTLAIALVVATTLLPVMVPLLAVVDLVVDRSRSFRRARTWLLFTTALAIEASGLSKAVFLRLRHARNPHGPAAAHADYELELWWVGRHARNLRRYAGVRWVMENPHLAHQGNAVAIARHASHADSILPLLVFGTVGGLQLRYTLKESLQWAPAMDVVGSRTPNVFVDRTPTSESPLLDRIENLAAEMGPDGVAVIFPEGTFYTPERLHRAATRLGQTRPDLEDDARRLRHILPPRPAGTLALLRGAPDADVVFVGHEGMAGFGSLREIARRIPLHEPVRVRLWRVDRREVPADEKELVTWLLDRWLDVDDWITMRAEERARGMVTPDLLATMEEIRT